jgi:hypothetical protein
MIELEDTVLMLRITNMSLQAKVDVMSGGKRANVRGPSVDEPAKNTKSSGKDNTLGVGATASKQKATIKQDPDYGFSVVKSQKDHEKAAGRPDEDDESDNESWATTPAGSDISTEDFLEYQDALEDEDEDEDGINSDYED